MVLQEVPIQVFAKANQKGCARRVQWKLVQPYLEGREIGESRTGSAVATVVAERERERL